LVVIGSEESLAKIRKDNEWAQKIQKQTFL
jgi:hypothetical protein